MNGRAADRRWGYMAVAGDEKRGYGSTSSIGSEQLTGEIWTFRISRRSTLTAGTRRSAQDLGVVVEDVATQDPVRWSGGVSCTSSR